MKEKLKNILLGLFFITIILATPILINRIENEKNNDTYEIGVNSKTIFDLNAEQRAFLFDKLKTVDISTIILENITLYEIEKYRDLDITNVYDFSIRDKKELSKYIPEDANKENIIIELNVKGFLEDEVKIIEEFLQDYKIYSDEETILFYVDKPQVIRSNGEEISHPIISRPFFIDQQSVADIKSNGFNVVIGVRNPSEEDVQKLLLNQIISIKEKYDVNHVQARGEMVLGYPDNVANYFEEMQENGIFVSLTEFHTKMGLTTYSNLNEGNITRAHEISVDELKLSEDDLGARISRAIKERNMRFIAIKNFIDYKDEKSIEKSINELINAVKIAQSQLANQFEQGIVKPLPIMEKDNISQMLIAISFSALVGALVLSIVSNNKIAIVLTVLSLVGGLCVVLTGINVLVKIYTLGVAIIGACSAIIIPYKYKNNSYLLKYIMSFVFCILTGIMVSSIMYGTDYMLKLKSFAGVKLLYIAPPVLIAIWATVTSNTIDFKQLKTIDSAKQIIIQKIKNINLYHCMGLVIILIGTYVYISRSGNSGNATELELEFRALMEKVLYARPRTKEFMLGYPALFIGFYLYKQRYKYSQYILILGAIATMSTVNTFTHLHTPFLYSLLRSIYGVVFGLIIAIIYIAIFKVGKKYLDKSARRG